MLATTKTAVTITGKVLVPAALPSCFLAADIISGTTALPLTIVAAVGGACWYLNGRFTAIEIHSEDLKIRLGRIEQKMDSLPCLGCPPVDNRRKIKQIKPHE